MKMAVWLEERSAMQAIVLAGGTLTVQNETFQAAL
jgi:hypothetical protein